MKSCLLTIFTSQQWKGAFTPPPLARFLWMGGTMFTKLSECQLALHTLKTISQVSLRMGNRSHTRSPCSSSDTVGICACAFGFVDSAGALITSTLCPLKPPKRERPLSRRRVWCGPDPPHMWGMSSLNERGPFANEQPQRGNCNLILVFSVGGKTERESGTSRRERERDGEGTRKKPFLSFFYEAASSNQSDVLSWPAVCPDGFYGLDCGQMCECRNGARCHHITGACLCTAGWAGPHCILGNGSHIIKTGCEGGSLCSPSRHPLLKHNYDVFVNNYLYNETLPMTFFRDG